jgi:L-2-amino-thiazoline-4-carboxylic acid hydrolase
VILKLSNLASNRREFLLNILPAGTLLCLGCGSMSGWTASQEEQKAAEKKHKFLEDSWMSFQEVFQFAYRDHIEVMQFLAKEIGKDKFMEMLKRDGDEWAKREAEKGLKTLAANDFDTFRAGTRKKPNRFWEHVITSSLVEDTGLAIEKKVTECLWAKTYREAKAADLGYVLCCYPDFPSASAFNPKIRLIRTKTLMQGDDCCNFRWVWEG